MRKRSQGRVGRRRLRESEEQRGKRLRKKGVKFASDGMGGIRVTEVPLAPEVADEMRALFKRYEAKIGRPADPRATVGDVIKELSGMELGSKGFMDVMLLDLWEAGIEPAKIYAVWKSGGMLVSEENIDIIDPGKLQAWLGHQDAYREVVDGGQNPFAGSSLEALWRSLFSAPS